MKRRRQPGAAKAQEHLREFPFLYYILDGAIFPWLTATPLRTEREVKTALLKQMSPDDEAWAVVGVWGSGEHIHKIGASEEVTIAEAVQELIDKIAVEGKDIVRLVCIVIRDPFQNCLVCPAPLQLRKRNAYTAWVRCLADGAEEAK